MKKIMILTALMVFCVATYSFAACSQSTTTYTCDQGAGWSVSLSKSVTLDYDVTTDHLYYSIATAHASGDKTYGSSSVDTKIFYQNNTTGTAPTAATTSPFSGWTAM